MYRIPINWPLKVTRFVGVLIVLIAATRGDGMWMALGGVVAIGALVAEFLWIRAKIRARRKPQ